MLLQPFCNYYGYWACRWCLTNTRWHGAASSAHPNHIESHREIKKPMRWLIVFESYQNFLKDPCVLKLLEVARGLWGVGCVDLFMCDTVDKLAETQISIWKAIHLVRAPNSRSGGHELSSNPICAGFGALKWKDTWGQVFP
jgi:hypothetical protein